MGVMGEDIKMKASEIRERQMSHQHFDWLFIMGLKETRRFFNLHGQSIWRIWNPWED